MLMRDLIRAAKEYDIAHRPFGKNWTSVPDSQVARLLIGAKIAAESDEQRQDTPDKQE